MGENIKSNPTLNRTELYDVNRVIYQKYYIFEEL